MNGEDEILSAADDRLRKLEQAFERFRMSADDLITVDGSLGLGYAINTQQLLEGAATLIGPPPVDVIGACCYGGAAISCVNVTYADCLTLGGRWSGVPCSPTFCTTGGGGGPPCVGASLKCEIVTAERGKCGFTPFTGGTNRHFLAYTDSKNWSHSTAVIPCDEFSLCQQVQELDFYWNMQFDSICNPDNNCADGCPCFTSICEGLNTGHHDPGCGSAPCATVPIPGSCSCGWCCGGTCPAYYLACICSGPVTSMSETYILDLWSCPSGAIGSCPPSSGQYYDLCNGSRTRTRTLSNEYTTAMLKSVTQAALPPFPNTFTLTTPYCVSSANLSIDESAYAIQRMQYKFVFTQPVLSFCLIWWIERTNNGGGDVTMVEMISPGQTESSVHIIAEPEVTAGEPRSTWVVYPIPG